MPAKAPAARPPRSSRGPSATDLDEEMRAFYQRRLALLFAVMTGVVSFVTATGWLFVLVGARFASLAPQLAGTVTAAVMALCWRWCKRGRLGQRTLERLDAFGMLAHIYIFLGTTGAWQRSGKIGAFQVMMVTYLLMTRAIVVPSSGRRTLMIALAATIPTTAIATYLRLADPRMQEALPQALLSIAQPMVLTTVLVYFASRVIFGLRKQVQAATRIGQYVLKEKLGEGGMGVVYRATHAMLRRDTALKLLWPDRIGEAHLARFEREVTLTARLTHPNTISVFDYGRTPDGVFYYSMEYLDGLSLQQLVDGDGPLPPGRVVHLVRQACGALAEAHGAGLIHRDLKPANILVCVRGGVPDHVKVLDFGLVKDVAMDDSSVAESSADGLLGTPLYMSPESITGATPVDARTDIYALGAVAYFLLTGQPPFVGSTIAQICGQHLYEAPAPPSEHTRQPVPPALEALVLRCLAKQPGDRPADVGEIGRALAAADVGAPWHEADAARWWKERGPVVRAEAQARQGTAARSLPSQRTIAVELDGRAPASA